MLELIQLGLLSFFLIQFISILYLISCKKRSQTIHKLTDGIIVSTIKSEHHNDLSPVLSNNRTNDDRCDTVTNVHCTHCGK
jgi:hypothetical protein